MIAIAGGILIVLAILAVAYLGLAMVGNGDAGPGFMLFAGAIIAAVWVMF